ncbi:MAG: acyltransferase family protein [Woeseiaceae bacterium]|nr:acyltransferase family protein [Woeseiaceae bacterium]
MKYRAEIDGLRAVAVVPVLFFHAGFEQFSGGFVGVDVFFVISGYLITSIIWKEMEQGSFSLLDFYERRARRILPALFFVILVSIPFAWIWLLPRDLLDFAQSIVAVVTFSSNVLFWLESDYFATAAELKPLLHTWSLAVEEQYYILFPLFLMVMWRSGANVIYCVLAFVFAISLAMAQWSAFSHPNAAFYLLPTRGWEILLGAFCAFYLMKKGAVACTVFSQTGSAFGLILIAIAVHGFDESTPTPSLYTVVPTLGTALVILLAVPGTLANALLSRKVFVMLGLVSYSLYLWHQPILALAKYRSPQELSAGYSLWLLFISVLLAIVSWRTIEAPFRRKNKTSRRLVFGSSALCASFLVVFGCILQFNIGNTLNLFREPLYSTDIRETLESVDQFDLEGSGSPVFIWGDSYADTLTVELGERLNQLGIPMTGFIMHSCPSILNVERNEAARMGKPFTSLCKDYTSETIAKIGNLASRYKSEAYVVLSSSYTRYMHEKNWDGEPVLLDEVRRDLIGADHLPSNLARTVARLEELGLTPIVVLPHPKVVDFEAIIRAGSYKKSTVLASTTDARRDSHILIDALEDSSAHTVDVTEILCGEAPACPVFLQGSAEPYVWHDGSHLSRYGARLVVDEIVKIIVHTEH